MKLSFVQKNTVKPAMTFGEAIAICVPASLFVVGLVMLVIQYGGK